MIYAIALLINKFSVLKYRKVLGKPLYRLMEVIAVIFVLVHLVFACLVIGKVNAADGGVGIINRCLFCLMENCIESMKNVNFKWDQKKLIIMFILI